MPDVCLTCAWLLAAVRAGARAVVARQAARRRARAHRAARRRRQGGRARDGNPNPTFAEPANWLTLLKPAEGDWFELPKGAKPQAAAAAAVTTTTKTTKK